MAVEQMWTPIARRAAEAALVRVIHHYGTRPEFVVLGGLVPESLCSSSHLLEPDASGDGQLGRRTVPTPKQPSQPALRRFTHPESKAATPAPES